MGTILDVLQDKGTDVYCIDVRATVFEAVGAMVENNVGSLLVTDQALLPDYAPACGIITERDYLSKIVIRGKTSHNTAVSEIMSPLTRVAGIDDDIDACLCVMTELRIRHLPVVQDGNIVGLVSLGDLTKRKLLETRTDFDRVLGYLQGVPSLLTYESICYGSGKTGLFEN
jgi:signal-transduction protein with cAMP-binding, CBS, and nucleotidyltransferase domain